MSGIYGYPTDPAQTSGTVGTSAGEAGTVITEDATQVKALNNAMRGLAGDLGNFRDDISAANSTASASGTAYVLATSSQISALGDGVRLTWLPDADNTGAATLNVDTLGAKKLLHDSAVLAAGEIKAGHPVDCVYDASADSAAGAWLVLNPVPVAGSFTSDDIGDDSTYGEASVTAALDQIATDVAGKQDALTNPALLGAVQTFTKTQIGEVLALTHNTAWDARESQNLTVDVDGSNFTIANPTNLQAGAYYAITVTYTTTHTLAWGNLFRGVAALSLSATAGMADHIVFRCDGTNLDCVGFRADVEAT